MGEFHYHPSSAPPPPSSHPSLSPLCPPLSLVGQTMVRWQWSPEPPPPRPLITAHCPKPWLSTGVGGRGAFMARLRKLQCSDASGLKLQLAYWSRDWSGLIKVPLLPIRGPQRAHCHHLPRHCWPSTALCRRLIPRFLSVALGSILILFASKSQTVPGCSNSNCPRLYTDQLSLIWSHSVEKSLLFRLLFYSWIKVF